LLICIVAHVNMHGGRELNGEDGSEAHSLAGPVGFEPTPYGLRAHVDMYAVVHGIMHINASLLSLAG